MERNIYQKFLNLAKYTFTEQCEEVRGLHLEDGTTKIFLNMSSKNGSQELVSLLQYMKDTTLENPNITVKDERLLELDRIVGEVKKNSTLLLEGDFSCDIWKGMADGLCPIRLFPRATSQAAALARIFGDCRE